MTPTQQLEQRVSELEGLVRSLLKSDRYIFDKNLQLENGRNIQLGVGTGTKIGTYGAAGFSIATADIPPNPQKIGFFGATPIGPQNMSFPISTGDLYTVLNAFGLVYHAT